MVARETKHKLPVTMEGSPSRDDSNKAFNCKLLQWRPEASEHRAKRKNRTAKNSLCKYLKLPRTFGSQKITPSLRKQKNTHLNHGVKQSLKIVYPLVLSFPVTGSDLVGINCSVNRISNYNCWFISSFAMCQILLSG